MTFHNKSTAVERVLGGRGWSGGGAVRERLQQYNASVPSPSLTCLLNPHSAAAAASFAAYKDGWWLDVMTPDTPSR